MGGLAKTWLVARARSSPGWRAALTFARAGGSRNLRQEPLIPRSYRPHQRHFLWWIGIFNTWAISERPPQRFPILSGAVFQADPSRLQILISDAAGDDGMEYYFCSQLRRTRVPHSALGQPLSLRPLLARRGASPSITSSTERPFSITSSCGEPTVRVACTASTVRCLQDRGRPRSH